MAETVILASGTGSNFAHIADELAGSAHQVRMLVTDRPDAAVRQKAQARGIPDICVPYADRSRNQSEQEIIRTIATPDLVVLAGFMRLLSPEFVRHYSGRIINIHPSMLPAYPGLHAIERSWADSSVEMGITIHYVDEGMDTGPIIEQHRLNRSGLGNCEEAERAIHELEHRYYPACVRRLLDNTHRKDT